MSEIEDLLREFPSAVREQLRRSWDEIPEAARVPLTKALRDLPADLGRWRELMRLALSQVRVVTGAKRRVAIVGPANVGKSTLYNQLVRDASDRAEVSAVPGTTRVSRSTRSFRINWVQGRGAREFSKAQVRARRLRCSAQPVARRASRDAFRVF